MSANLPKEDPTYSEIVWKQFRKRPGPYYALWGVITLALIAIYCPIFISNKPFLWQVDGGSLESPWLQSLFLTETFLRAPWISHSMPCSFQVRSF